MERGTATRIPALDGVRGLAVLGVIAGHATVYTTRTDITSVDRIVLFGGVLVGTGLDLFFVLSGCLITGILLDSRDSERYFATFYRRRALRIFPLYYAVLLFVFFVLPGIAPDDGQAARELADQSPLWFVLYGFNILAFARDSALPGVLAHSWSLALEEQFYLAWPLVVRFVPVGRLKWIACGVAAVGVGSRVALVAAGASGLALRVFPLARLDCLAVGAIVALALRGLAGVPARRLPALFVAIAAPLLAVRALGWKGTLAHASCDVFSFALLYGALVTLAAWPRPAHVVSSALTWWPLRTLGKHSYALYLVHPLAWFLLRARLEAALAPIRPSAGLSWILNFVVLGAVSLAVALVTWHVLEKPCLDLRDGNPWRRDRPFRGAQAGRRA